MVIRAKWNNAEVWHPDKEQLLKAFLEFAYHVAISDGEKDNPQLINLVTLTTTFECGDTFVECYRDHPLADEEDEMLIAAMIRRLDSFHDEPSLCFEEHILDVPGRARRYPWKRVVSMFLGTDTESDKE